MIRPWHIWVVFGLCLGVVLTVLGWISLTALRLEREQAEARSRAALEETVRLSLWRMESAVAPLLAQESGRPYFWYTAFYPAERAYTRMFSEIKQGEVLVPSPLLTDSSPYVLLHFQIGPDGQATSPQVPGGNMRELAQTIYTTKSEIDAAEKRLSGLVSQRLFERLDAALPREPQQSDSALVGVQAANPERSNAGPASRDSQEWQMRSQRVQTQQEIVKTNIAVTPFSANVRGGLPAPVWLDSETLLLARRVMVNGQAYIQGCWLNWPAVRRLLLQEIRDLLPEADLRPIGAGTAREQSRVLASLPVWLLPGKFPEAAPEGHSAMALSLLVAWCCVVLAGAAVAILLLGTVSLSERRAAFVSAVTHELRTPLTTFRMYSEMLAEKMVTDEEKRTRYLKTLQAEAARLSHLVENVLAYARLEGNRTGGHIEKLPLGELVNRTTERLSDRARQANMELRIAVRPDAQRRLVQADVGAVEQILFNLVDNSCKYAAKAADRTIQLDAWAAGEWAVLRVCDHGPGISKADRARLFQPFSKSAHQAAHSAPGVGLGLALSRKLARQMSGQLFNADHTVNGGACFQLTLPAV